MGKSCATSTLDLRSCRLHDLDHFAQDISELCRFESNLQHGRVKSRNRFTTASRRSISSENLRRLHRI